jgi:hypothetical protein
LIYSSVSAVLIGTNLRLLQLNNKEDLGTYDDPEVALEKLKSISTASNHVNVGIEGVQHLQEFDKSKK